MKRTKCTHIRPMLSDYLDGALSNDATWQVKMHLTVCQECADLAASLGKTVALINTVSAPSLSANFDSGLTSRVQVLAEQRKSAKAGFWLSRLARRVTDGFSYMYVMSDRRVRVSAPIALATVMLGMLALFTSPANVPNVQSAAPADQGFTEACIHQNHTYISGQAFADPSAQALSQRQSDNNIGQQGADLLGSGSI